PSRRDDENIRTSRVRGELTRAAVTHRHRRVDPGLYHQRGHRFAHDVAATDDDTVCAGRAHVVRLQHVQHTRWRAWREAVALPDEELPHVHGMEAVDVFVRADTAHDRIGVDLLG